jgi:hypothetical protein
MSIGWGDVPSIATGVGVLLAAYQLRQAKRSLREGFERTFVDRYERIVADIDLEVLLGHAQPDLDVPRQRRAFFDYFELCEEELYYRSYRRVSSSTWRDWWYGIRLNFQNQSFIDAFERILGEANDVGDGVPVKHHRFERLKNALAHRRVAGYEPKKASLRERLW